MSKQKLVIVGGGIAGLVAARKLSGYYEIIILEALTRFGGRIWTIDEQGFPLAIEGGAEFVHGEAVQTINLLHEAGISFHQVEGEFYQKKGAHLEKNQENNSEWNILLEKMGAIESDMTLQHFFDVFFSGKKFSDLRNRAITFAGGFDLADKDSVSVKSLYQEWSNQSEDYRVKGGYSLLIDFLLAECSKSNCKMITDATVTKISWKEGTVEVTTGDLKSYKADKCLITVPIGVLQKKKLRFEPPLDSYLSAVHKIGFGTVVKVILTFKNKFWNDDTGFIFSDEAIPTWWTQLPEKTPVLTGWAGGPRGTLLEGYNDKKLLQKALESLSAIFNLSIAEIKENIVATAVFNWKKQVNSIGAYSFATPESNEALKLLNEPIENTLYFAGEGLYAGEHPGTVEAAIVSSQEVIRQLKL